MISRPVLDLKERKRKITIAHLKEENKIVSKENFSKQAAVSTMSGKKLISKFLTKQLKYVDLKNNLIVDIDSEAYLSECECQNDDHCQWDLYATPSKPDGSKNATNKSPGVKKALLNLIKTCQVAKSLHTSSSGDSDEDQRVLLDFKMLPAHIRNNANLSIVEFAGTKFKVFASSGQQYVRFVSNAIIKKLVSSLPNLKRIVICEEKYSFTPDDFKANRLIRTTNKATALTVNSKYVLRYYASGSFSQAIRDTLGYDKGTVSRVVSDVTDALIDIKDDFEQQPQPPQIQQHQQPTIQELMPTPSPYAAQPIRVIGSSNNKRPSTLPRCGLPSKKPKGGENFDPMELFNQLRID
ncbi:unnamed protein product [Mytilus edulis]|uniref:Uncharacterized protein n=1 Tax=Mytilus edulis TaxID=6550 RepID=A0A8S3Q5M6_MYTED|nr:unnamed protein product [Mytilus edulis]